MSKFKSRALIGSAIIMCVLMVEQLACGQSQWQSECKAEIRGEYRYIDANGIPNHATGEFPNRNNPNGIAPQEYHVRVPMEPTPAHGQARPQGWSFGIAVNGVMFDPGTAEFWNGDRRWAYEAMTGLMASRGSMGVDENNAHVQPNGAYHYHGLPMGLLERLNYRNKMTLVGYAADGYPIYGPYGYSDPDDSRSTLKMLKSGYRLKNGSRPSGNDGPGGAYDGSFSQDYEWVSSAGDLDAYNGRVGVTPEFPHGTFYYVLTKGWPFIPRMFYGTPDSSFSKGPPGNRGGRGGGPPGGGSNSGGHFGGPPGGGSNSGGHFGGPPGGGSNSGGHFGGPPGGGHFGGPPGGGPPGGGPLGGGPPGGGPPGGGPPGGGPPGGGPPGGGPPGGGLFGPPRGTVGDFD